MAKNNKKNFKINDSAKNFVPCIMCNPKKYLKFSFAYIQKEKSEPKQQDILKLWERFKWLSSDTFTNMIFQYSSDKKKWFEPIPIDKLDLKIPADFREEFPTETNEKFSILRIFPAGTPPGTANPRIIGMIKHTVFYIFYLDWKGDLYDHGR